MTSMLLGVVLSGTPLVVADRTDLGCLKPDAELNEFAKSVAADALTEFRKDGLEPGLFSITFVELDKSKTPQKFGEYRGDDPYYPASVVKLFFLAYAEHMIRTGKLKPSEEDQRAMHDMIVDSVNDATGHVVNWTTGALPGPELHGKAYDDWVNKRLAINRWFESLGYAGINACNRTFNEGPYGREWQLVGSKYERRNMLTSNMTARLMTEIALGRIVSPEACEGMLVLLKRKNPTDEKDADFQARAFVGKSIPSGAELFSKAGFTDSARHDIAYVRLPNGRQVVICVYTYKQAQKPLLIPFIAAKILARYSAPRAP